MPIPVPPVSIIPRPVCVKAQDGEFEFNDSTEIYIPADLQSVGNYLLGLLGKSSGPKISSTKVLPTGQVTKPTIILERVDLPEVYGQEGYQLDITPKKVKINASTERGVFYAIQTLRQAFPTGIERPGSKLPKRLSVPCMVVDDYPRFPWRGFMLDEARHFQGRDLVKRLLDVMALCKLNRFHWHLTDDQGWRIEIKSYPDLTRVGSERSETQIGGFLSKRSDETPHAGFYSQEDIREIVQYATDRFITVVPEIDLPGHTTSVLAAYPRLGCTGGPYQVATRFGIKKDILCVGKDASVEFVEKVLAELITLFPGEIIHIGGDEVPTDRWETCPDCQRRLQSEGLEEERDLQAYFTNRVVKILVNHGRRAMGWNEILSDDLPKDVIGQWWLRGRKKILKHLEQGRDIVMSKVWFTYLDYNYILTPLKKSYAYDPIPKGIAPESRSHVLGIEAPIWTEWVPNEDRLGWQVFPRLFALAEVGWTPVSRKDYANFQARLPDLVKRLEKLGFNHALLNIVDPGRLKRVVRFASVLGDPSDRV